MLKRRANTEGEAKTANRPGKAREADSSWEAGGRRCRHLRMQGTQGPLAHGRDPMHAPGQDVGPAPRWGLPLLFPLEGQRRQLSGEKTQAGQRPTWEPLCREQSFGPVRALLRSCPPFSDINNPQAWVTNRHRSSTDHGVQSSQDRMSTGEPRTEELPEVRGADT